MITSRTVYRKIVIPIGAMLVLALAGSMGCKRGSVAPPPAVAATPDPWKEAVDKVEQDRGESVGRKATVNVPKQLKHYADRRRFLAVQAADSQPRDNVSPHDFADLVPLIERHQLVEMKPLGGDYILYGVGQNVGGEPFTHYDRATRQDIPLVGTQEELKDEVNRALNAVKECEARLAYLEVERRRTPKRDRQRRTTLLNEVAQARKAVASEKTRSKLLASHYANGELRKSLLAEYQWLSELARDFAGESYDLKDSDARRRLKMRLLSFVRPEARGVLMQIAREYKEKFDRPLPVSSLVRPVQYQHELAGTNPNAARGSAPPHATGLAFDLYYGYMNAAEQEYLMAVIARLKDEGGVEALRESRENIHVYVFAGGRRPDEKLVAQVIARDRSRRPSKKPRDMSRR